MEKVVEGIYLKKMPLPYSLKSINIYFIEGEFGYTVIDTGDTELSISVWEKILETNIKIEQIVLTHLHPDHCGLAEWLQQKLNVPVMISLQSLTDIKRIRNMKEASQTLLPFLNRYIYLEIPNNEFDMPNPYNFVVNRIYEDGDTLKFGSFNFKAIWVPGHSYDQYCFYNEQLEIMIVGDHIMSGISPMLELRGVPRENPLAHYLKSLRRIQSYPVQLALPGHGEVIQDLKEEIDKVVERHYYRLNQITDFLKIGTKTGQQIFENTYKNSDPRFYVEQLISVVSRLLFLESIGILESHQKHNEERTYSLKDGQQLEQLLKKYMEV